MDGWRIMSRSWRVCLILVWMISVAASAPGNRDVSSVSAGFAVTWGQLLSNTLLALGYALPFSVAGYYILKKREVAA